MNLHFFLSSIIVDDKYNRELLIKLKKGGVGLYIVFTCFGFSVYMFVSLGRNS